jgi:hypothetical protein
MSGGCLCGGVRFELTEPAPGDPGVRPSWRTYVAYAAAWEPIPDDGLARVAEGKPRS